MCMEKSQKERFLCLLYCILSKMLTFRLGSAPVGPDQCVLSRWFSIDSLVNVECSFKNGIAILNFWHCHLVTEAGERMSANLSQCATDYLHFRDTNNPYAVEMWLFFQPHAYDQEGKEVQNVRKPAGEDIKTLSWPFTSFWRYCHSKHKPVCVTDVSKLFVLHPLSPLLPTDPIVVLLKQYFCSDTNFPKVNSFGHLTFSYHLT